MNTARRGRDMKKAIKLIMRVGLLPPAVTYWVEVALAVAVAPTGPAEVITTGGGD